MQLPPKDTAKPQQNQRLETRHVGGFSYEPPNRCFARGFRQFSAHLTKCHVCHGNCTLPPLEAALTMRFAKNTQHDSSKCCKDGHVQSAAPATKTATHLLKTSQKYRACHTKRFSTRYETRLNLRQCHACHAKRGFVTFETSKSDRCRTRQGHGHSDLARTVAKGCERFFQRRMNTPTPPRPPE